jgi:hypothetical protein
MNRLFSRDPNQIGSINPAFFEGIMRKFPEVRESKASGGYSYLLGGFSHFGGDRMNTQDFKRKLTAIMSADVAGYSRLMGDNESETVRTLETYKEIIFSLIKQHRGRVVDSPGDNLLAEFASVVDAVQCGVAVQNELKARNADLPENRKIAFRIGVLGLWKEDRGNKNYGKKLLFTWKLCQKSVQDRSK